jgi:hypothetical protein
LTDHGAGVRRRLAFSALTLALVLLVGEAIAWLAFAVAPRRMTFQWHDFDALGPVPTQAEMDTWRTWGWDRELGWLHRPNTEETVVEAEGTWRYGFDDRGARREPRGGTGGLVSAYGDSFTFGHEVNDDETWPHYLSERLATRVDNWGQTAWGPDQAILRLARNLPRERTAVVVLAVMSENIARLLSSYRPFLTGERAMKMAFKPMLTVDEGGGVRWLPNPMERADTPEDWTAALARARTTDVWYRENAERVRARFPFLLRLPEALAYTVRHGVEGEDLYGHPDAVARLDFVMDELVRLAHLHDFVPVALFIPQPSDLRQTADGRTAQYQGYVAALRARTAAVGLRVVDVAERPFDAARFNRLPFKDHPSPYGQRVIADAVAAVIAGVPAIGDRASTNGSRGITD